MSILTSAKLYVGAYDLTGYANQLTPEPQPETKDCTTFASAGFKEHVAGLEAFSLKGHIFVEADATSVDTYKTHDIIRAYWKTADVPVTYSLQSGASGEMCGMFRATQGAYAPGQRVGDLIACDFLAQTSTGPHVYGTVLHNAAVTAGASSTARQLGLVAAGKSIYGVLHVLSCTGTLTLKIQSDDNSGFTSATDRISFTAATGKTFQWASLAGAIADDTYWRATWTLPSGGATFIVSAGIL